MTETVKRIIDIMASCGENPRQLEPAANLPNSTIQNLIKYKKDKDDKYSI